ncbi:MULTISPECIES: hypothetical protein [Butyricimonas]|uniref:hypothetical protein n=1 Tax=Butyricimonas TaxID=574697 RepID=UPI00165280B1|nr:MULTISPECIES: hypothetical protein [Butyricimonas]
MQVEGIYHPGLQGGNTGAGGCLLPVSLERGSGSLNLKHKTDTLRRWELLGFIRAGRCEKRHYQCSRS